MQVDWRVEYVNSVAVIGRLGLDFTVVQTHTGRPVTRNQLAVRGRNERTDWWVLLARLGEQKALSFKQPLCAYRQLQRHACLPARLSSSRKGSLAALKQASANEICARVEIEVWGELAERAAAELTKGTQVQARPPNMCQVQPGISQPGVQQSCMPAVKSC